MNDLLTSSLLDIVKPGDVKTIAGKYLSGDNYIRLVLMPESTVSKTAQ
jgi:zinc protease